MSSIGLCFASKQAVVVLRNAIIIERGTMLPSHRISAHPGRILLREFLEPSGTTQAQLARELGIPQNRVNELIRGKRGVTAETALLLSAYFGNSAEFWMQLQTAHDLTKARQEMSLRRRLRNGRPRRRVSKTA